MNTLTLLLLAAGILQFAILTASALVPRVLDWKQSLAPLHPFVRSLFWVYGSFIVLIIVSFGTLTLCFATPLSEGTPLARGVCSLIGVFWAARLIVQFFVFDATPFLTRPLLKVGYHALTGAFSYLTAVYALAATFPEVFR